MSLFERESHAEWMKRFKEAPRPAYMPETPNIATSYENNLDRVVRLEANAVQRKQELGQHRERVMYLITEVFTHLRDENYAEQLKQEIGTCLEMREPTLTRDMLSKLVSVHDQLDTTFRDTSGEIALRQAAMDCQTALDEQKTQSNGRKSP